MLAIQQLLHYDGDYGDVAKAEKIWKSNFMVAIITVITGRGAFLTFWTVLHLTLTIFLGDKKFDTIFSLY